MCMDSSPIAGLVVNLQHQMLSCRTIVLNPLKRKYNCSNQKLLKTDLYNESNDNIKTSMLSNKPQKESSKLMVRRKKCLIISNRTYSCKVQMYLF